MQSETSQRPCYPANCQTESRLHVCTWACVQGLVACRDTDPKRVYYMSMEFLMGRSLTNALNALDLVEPYHKALRDVG